jgi:hypothetical protein
VDHLSPLVLYPPVDLPSLRPISVGLVDLLHLILEALHRPLAHPLVTRDPPQMVLHQQAVPPSLLVPPECILIGCE